jgi:hypothetical protein
VSVKPDYGRLSLVDCLEAGKTSRKKAQSPPRQKVILEESILPDSLSLTL